MSYWINLHKPLGISSNKAISILRRTLGIRKIGHAGTLDPLACGVLPIAVGEATKSVQFVQADEKEYIFTIKFGESTTTDDTEGEITETSPHLPTQLEIEGILPQFIGHITQTPPIFSALKINGKRAYDLARNGEKPVMKSRQIHIHSLTLISTTQHTATLKTKCGKGTYIRSLGRDIAQSLTTCGHITYLERTQVGKFHKNSTKTLDFINDNATNKASFMMPILEVLDDIPVLQLTNEQYHKVQDGVKFTTDPALEGTYIAVYDNILQAILSLSDGLATIKRGFNLT